MAFKQKELPVSLEAFIRSQIEPREPFDTILKFFQANEGKRLDKRLFTKINKEIPGLNFRVQHRGNMTYIQWGDETPPNSNQKPVEEGRLFMAYTLVNVMIDTPFILEHNICHYAAADRRNEARLDLLQQPQFLQDLEKDIKALIALRIKVKETLKHPLLSPDWIGVETAYGIEDPR